MNKQQFATLAVAIKSAYPASRVLEEAESMDFWYLMLRDIDYVVAENAISEHICTNIYPPNIAEIRKLCAERTQKPILSFDDAWGTVQRAMRLYGKEEPGKAYALMDEITSSVVDNLGWYRLCTSENPSADRANFREAYEAKAKKAQNNIQLPEFVAEGKLQIQGKYIPAIEEKAVPQIEDSRQRDTREELTEEQIAYREQLLEETRRCLLGGKKE